MSFLDEPDSSENDEESTPQESHCGLVHAAGYGILDTGCGRGLTGRREDSGQTCPEAEGAWL